MDQASITLEEGVDVPFRNLWSDHEWLGTARVREGASKSKQSVVERGTPGIHVGEFTPRRGGGTLRRLSACLLNRRFGYLT